MHAMFARVRGSRMRVQSEMRLVSQAKGAVRPGRGCSWS
jgi:hypothetical protein